MRSIPEEEALMIARLQSWILALSELESDLEKQGWSIACGADLGFVYYRAQQDKNLSVEVWLP
jgi:hypothetical protein